MPDAFHHTLPCPVFNAKAREQIRRGVHCGSKGQRFRRRWLSQHPLCADCGRLAECVHHIVPRHAAPERMFDPTNLASLCNACHAARHRAHF